MGNPSNLMMTFETAGCADEYKIINSRKNPLIFIDGELQLIKSPNVSDRVEIYHNERRMTGISLQSLHDNNLNFIRFTCREDPYCHPALYGMNVPFFFKYGDEIILKTFGAGEICVIVKLYFFEDKM